MADPIHDPELTPLEAALAYARRGWRVIPIPPGLKYPKGFPAWQREGSTDEAKIRHWWGQAPDHGIGIVTGASSGIWVLDIDVSEGKRGDETLAELEVAYGPLPASYEVITGSGGRHIYFAWEDGHEIHNSASGALGPGIDVRGEGGFVVAPPSIHANGNAYMVEASAPDTVAAAPPWVTGILGATPTTDAPAPAWERVQTGDAPGHAWAATVTWSELLAADGWTLSHTDRTGEEHWVRPGKDKREGTSATVGYKGSDVLKVFTSSMTGAGLEPEITYSKFGYYTATRHDGHYASAASELRSQGHGSQSAPSQPPSPDEPWPEPIPLGSDRYLAPFPVHVLPDWMADYAAEVAEDIQVPVDLPAMLALGALSTLAAGHVKVNVDGRWHENVNLYLVIAMPPSTGKSPAYKAMCAPVKGLEQEYQLQTRAEIAANSDMVDVIEAELKRTKQLADVDQTTLEEIRGRLYTAQDKPTIAPKLTVGDVTPEALGKLLADNGGRMAIHSTEGGVFDVMAGRYSDRANLDVYLQAWSGDSIDIVRIGRESNSTTEAVLTVLLTVQPGVIAALADNAALAGRGLTARFMYAVPEDRLGHRDLSLRTRTDRTCHDRYGDELRTIGRRLMSWQTPATLTIDTDAAQHYTDWRQLLEDRRTPLGDLRPMAEWSGKLESSVLRTAGLLHIAHGHAIGEPIGLVTISQAITIGDYWLAHAAHVHDIWGSSPALIAARKILEWAQMSGRSTFTVRDVHVAHRTMFPRAEDCLDPLALLTERGWLRTCDTGPVTTQRNRRSVEFALYPDIRELSTVSVSPVLPVLRTIINNLTYSSFSQEEGRPPAHVAQVAQVDSDDPSPTTDRVDHSEYDPGSDPDSILYRNEADE